MASPLPQPRRRTARMLHWNHSTWLAKRALEARELRVELPTVVALPGAKRGIPHDRLCALQAAGHGELAIVERTNAEWREENAARLLEHDAWVAGPYHSTIEEMRRRELEARAAELRRAALLAQVIDREAEG